ncbi:MAG: TIGR04283 family arsenosugar biosynthesis glycosyltransferase [Chthoniobacterales bacterium]|nr:TIGR04283 family arsenosugar biosynthesis glycosyltransferase [Chthoniobacterales bacterium]
MAEISDRAAAGSSAPTISIIVPSWHDAENLSALLPVLAGLNGIREIIVADAGGDAATEHLARRHGAILCSCPAPNRGAQMNLGARAASADMLLFQHADTELTARHVSAIDLACREPAVIGGAFFRKFDDRHPRLMWLEQFARFLTRNGGTLYGDQSVFVRREVFSQLDGFAEIPLMEDMEFSRRLRAAGKVVVLDPPVGTSSRRHSREGAWRKTIQNGLFILLYKIGVSPRRLHRWYYADRPASGPQADKSFPQEPRAAER